MKQNLQVLRNNVSFLQWPIFQIQSFTLITLSNAPDSICCDKTEKCIISYNNKIDSLTSFSSNLLAQEF
jgi:hypothetical protein